MTDRSYPNNNIAIDSNDSYHKLRQICYNNAKSLIFIVVDCLMIVDDVDQHPLIFHLLICATQQMQGQQSLPIEAKYFKQLRSAGTSAPFSLAALSQTGKALLMSSMQRTSRSWGHSAFWPPQQARASKARITKISFILVDLLLLIKGFQHDFKSVLHPIEQIR